MTLDQIRQIPKIAGTVHKDLTVVMEKYQNIPDRAISIAEISRIMNNYDIDESLESKVCTTPLGEQTVKARWTQICKNEEARIQQAERRYNELLRQMQIKDI